MDAQTIALALIAVLIILAIVAFGWRTYERRGTAPSFQREVFLWFDPNSTSPNLNAATSTAAALKSVVASPGQVSLYAAGGGSAAGAGITSTGDIYWAPGPQYAGSTAFEKLGTGLPYGVWLFGPKPAKETPNVMPFSCQSWYQDHSAASSAGPAAGMASRATTLAASRLATAQRRFAHRMRGEALRQTRPSKQ